MKFDRFTRNQLAYLTAVLLLCAAFTSRSYGALIVSVQSTNVPYGGSGMVNVFVRSDSGLDTVDIFSLALMIQGSGVQFSSPPTDQFLYDPNYLLFNDSAAAFVGPPAGLVTTTNSINDTYLGGDGTLSGLGITVPTTDTLLAAVQVEAGTTIPPQFSNPFLLDVQVDFFRPFEDQPVSVITSGTISVTPSSGTSIPEPSSLVTLGILLGLTTAIRFARSGIADSCRVEKIAPTFYTPNG